MLQDWRGRFSVREKGPADLVTDADEASQEAVRLTILTAFPDHDVLAEEDRALEERKSDYRWIVDPLDGTTNYVHGVPHYAVSIAMEHNGRLIAAAVYDPSADECFTAGFGDGARVNATPIRASETTLLGEALVAVSFPALVERGSRSLEDFLKLIVRSRAVRRTGSAALNLCYVAAGRFDAYSARETRPWDVAAGGAFGARGGRDDCRHRRTAFYRGQAAVYCHGVAGIECNALGLDWRRRLMGRRGQKQKRPAIAVSPYDAEFSAHAAFLSTQLSATFSGLFDSHDLLLFISDWYTRRAGGTKPRF